MASLDLATLLIKIDADINDAKQGFKDVGEASQQAAGQATQSWESTSALLMSMGQSLYKNVTQPIMKAFSTAVEYAADFTETMGKTEVVFGSLSEGIIAWSETSIEAMGIAQGTALEMVSLYGDMATGMGIASSEAATMSKQMVQLAADLSSFKNIGIEQASSALEGIFTGQGKALQQLGIIMNETTLSEYALSQGITTAYSKMSESEKIMLRYQYVMSATANAQGDFARTGDSLANQQKKLSESIKELLTSVGQTLEPFITRIISAINRVVQWLNNLSPVIKKVVIAIAAAAAAIGPLLIVMAMIKPVILSINTALTTLMANPVMIWIMAITAALVAVAAIVAGVSASIDEYNKKVSNMKNASTTVDTTYQVLVEESETDNIDSVLTSIENAIAASSAANEYFVACAEVSDGDRSISSVLNSIDAAIKSREVYLEISGIKKEDDAIWNELNDYRNGVASGTITIYGVDGGGTLQHLSELAGQTSSDLVALKYYETNWVKPIVDAQSIEGAKKAAEDLYDKCGQIAGVDTSVEFNFTQTGLEEDGEIMTAVASFMTNNEQLVGSIDGVRDAVANLIAEQKKYYELIAEKQMIDLATAYNNQQISLEEYQKGVTAVNAQLQDLNDKADGAQTAVDTLEAALNDNDRSNDEQAIADFAKAIEGTGIAAEAAQDPLKTYSEATGQISEYMNAGATNAEAMAGTVALQEAAITQVADKMEGEISTAYSNYEQAIADADATQAESIAVVDEKIASLENEYNALDAYNQAIQKNDYNQEAALQSLKENNKDAYDTIIAIYGDEETALAQNCNAVIDLMVNKDNELMNETSNYEATIAEIEATGNAAREEAATTFATNMSSITSGFTAAELEAARQQAEQVGNTEVLSQVTRLQNMEGFITKVEGAVESGSAETLSTVISTINDIQGTENRAYTSSYNVGSALGEGIYNGLKSWGDSISSLAASIISDVEKASKKAGLINSPSKKMRDNVGKPLMEGIKVGMETETPNVIKSVKANMDKIITAGSNTLKGSFDLYDNRQAFVEPSVSKGNTTINQTNNFTSRTLTPYEQTRQLNRMNRDLAATFA